MKKYTSDQNLYQKRERCEELANYLINHQSTVRDTAAKYGISKSTVHKDVTQKLPHINPTLFREVKGLLDKNKAERHLRGGEATRMKYRKSADKTSEPS